MIFLELKDGPSIWAYKILEHFQSSFPKRNEYNVDKYRAKNVMKEIENIYGKD